MRRSTSFSELRSRRGHLHYANEANSYIPEIQTATQVKVISPTQEIWTMKYKFPGPFSPRIFTVLQLRRMSDSPRAGYDIWFASAQFSH